MIDSRKALQEYVRADFASMGGVTTAQKIKAIFVPCIWKFEKKLRVLEYYHNCKNHGIFKLVYAIKKISFERYSLKLGFTVPVNVFGPGLCICHSGTIVVNGNARVGANARVHAGVNIGSFSRFDENWRPDNAPVIGDNVYIGPGAKLFGKISVGNDVAVGANAVVNRDVPDHVTVAGVPFKIINNDGSDGMVIKGYGG